MSRNITTIGQAPTFSESLNKKDPQDNTKLKLALLNDHDLSSFSRNKPTNDNNKENLAEMCMMHSDQPTAILYALNNILLKK